jgi:hypothetical protein
MVVMSSGLLSTETVLPALPAVSSITPAPALGPVSGSIINNLLGSTDAFAMVSGSANTGVTMTPMITSALVLDTGAATSITSPLQEWTSAVPVRFVGASEPGWTLASVTFDHDAVASSTSRTELTEMQPTASEDVAESKDSSSDTHSMGVDAGVQSIFDLEMTPPASHGAVEPRKTDDSEPRPEDRNDDANPQPDAT